MSNTLFATSRPNDGDIRIDITFEKCIYYEPIKTSIVKSVFKEFYNDFNFDLYNGCESSLKVYKNDALLKAFTKTNELKISAIVDYLKTLKVNYD